MSEMIDRKRYPKLDLIMWDLACRHISPERAFHLYETRWRYMDTDRINPAERELIKRLTHDHGQGVMLLA